LQLHQNLVENSFISVLLIGVKRRITVDMIKETNNRRHSRTCISVLDDDGDERGSSFHSVLREIVGFLGSIEDMHIATIRPSFFWGQSLPQETA
jgi:hypothetical protein